MGGPEPETEDTHTVVHIGKGNRLSSGLRTSNLMCSLN